MDWTWDIAQQTHWRSAQRSGYYILGGPLKVLTDQPTKFCDKFESLCEQAVIDHHTTSKDHQERDGLVEPVVLTVKRALCKNDLQVGHHRESDLQFPWLAMGYRFSKQASWTPICFHFTSWSLVESLICHLQSTEILFWLWILMILIFGLSIFK